MKKTNLLNFIICILIINILSCKKYIQKQEENALVDMVTNGTWRVTGYYDHQVNNLTDSFAGYSFQFQKNGVVYGVKYGQQTNGTWTTDINALTITSNFTSPPYPLNLLNHVWKVTDSYVDSVAARTDVDSSYNILNLHKN